MGKCHFYTILTLLSLIPCCIVGIVLLRLYATVYQIKTDKEKPLVYYRALNPQEALSVWGEEDDQEE